MVGMKVISNRAVTQNKYQNGAELLKSNNKNTNQWINFFGRICSGNNKFQS